MEQLVDHAHRLVPLVGAGNVRDLGGWQTAAGSTMRRGRIFRGDDLADLTDEDVTVLTDVLGIRTVVDLRSADEVERAPGRLQPHRVRLLHRPLLARPTHAPNVLEEGAEVDLVERYLEYLVAGPRQVCAALTAVAASCDAPVLFHCSAGKDRTGVVAALLLSLVGVPAESIIDDYAFTEQRVDAVFGRLRARPALGTALARLPESMAHAYPRTMSGFLRGLATAHGSAQMWASGAGLPAAAVDALREQLMTPEHSAGAV